MLNKKESYAIIDKVLSYCNYYTMATLISHEEGLTRFANSEIHQNVFKSNNTLEITVYDGKKQSKNSTNILDDESLKELVRKTEQNLRFMPEGEYEIPKVTAPAEIANEEYDAELENAFGIPGRASLIKSCIESLDDDYTASGAFSLSKMVFAMGNNSGIKRFCRLDNVSFNTVITHKNGPSGYAEYATDKSADMDVTKLFNSAYSKAKAALNPESLEPGSYTVILEPLAVGDLLSYMSYVGFSAKSVDTGISFLAGKKGQQVFGENISIYDDHTDGNTFSLPFDFEGYERKKLNIIDQGVAKELAYDIRTALKEGVDTTGHGLGEASSGGFPINLIMKNGAKSLEDIIKETDNAILVTRFHYMNVVDPKKALFTALTRDGLYMVKNGQISHAVKNMRFTESMLNAFNKVTEVSKDRTKVPGFFGVSYVPALKIDDFHFTGKTE